MTATGPGGRTPATRAVRAIAPAKVNLSLEVLGRRDDGYHEIRTSALAVDLYDTLEASATGHALCEGRGERVSPRKIGRAHV